MSKGPKSEEAKEREMKIAALSALFFAVRLFRNDHGFPIEAVGQALAEADGTSRTAEK